MNCESHKFRKRIDSVLLGPHSPSIMQSLDVTSMEQSNGNELFNDEDEAVVDKLQSVFLGHSQFFDTAILLLDSKEVLQITSLDEFLVKLQIPQKDEKHLRIVSIIGNSGDGKSYTLNHAFFSGQQVFNTSTASTVCTSGIWAAFHAPDRTIYIDTEGFLENQNSRLILKVIAISDVVIYKTRADRFHGDTFNFLSCASRIFNKHFSKIVNRIGSTSTCGPALIIFHETKYTKPLQNCLSEAPEDFILKKRASQLDLSAFSSLNYLGAQTKTGITDFSPLKKLVNRACSNKRWKSAMDIFSALKTINDRFNGRVDENSWLFTPDVFFACNEECLSCKSKCEYSKGHLRDGQPHLCAKDCVYNSNLDNCTYLCKSCSERSNSEQKVTIKNLSSSWFSYVLPSYSIECPNCGELYKSHQFWSGSKVPTDCDTVQIKYTHVWSDINKKKQQYTMDILSNPGGHTGRKVFDSVAFFSESVAGVVRQPTKLLTSYMTDHIAPKYWKSNLEIIYCEGCQVEFGSSLSKHHCRSCGEGFCEKCSSKVAPVPRHGWTDPVRVCDKCYDMLQASSNSISPRHNPDLKVRQYGEFVIQTFSTVFDYPKELLKETIRPSYWVPDSQITSCKLCNIKFDEQSALHHCRDCGNGVCDGCSSNRKSVLHRGWDHPVRVCDSCFKGLN